MAKEIPDSRHRRARLTNLIVLVPDGCKKDSSPLERTWKEIVLEMSKQKGYTELAL